MPSCQLSLLLHLPRDHNLSTKLMVHKCIPIKLKKIVYNIRTYRQKALFSELLINWPILTRASFPSTRYLGAIFSAGDLVYFLDTRITLLIYIFLLNYIFHTLFATYLSIRCSFEQNTKEAHCLHEKFIRQQFSFSLLHFWGHFLGTHKVCTLPFSVWVQPPRTSLISMFSGLFN